MAPRKKLLAHENLSRKRQKVEKPINLKGVWSKPDRAMVSSIVTNNSSANPPMPGMEMLGLSIMRLRDSGDIADAVEKLSAVKTEIETHRKPTRVKEILQILKNLDHDDDPRALQSVMQVLRKMVDGWKTTYGDTRNAEFKLWGEIVIILLDLVSNKHSGNTKLVIELIKTCHSVIMREEKLFATHVARGRNVYNFDLCRSLRVEMVESIARAANSCENNELNMRFLDLMGCLATQGVRRMCWDTCWKENPDLVAFMEKLLEIGVVDLAHKTTPRNEHWRERVRSVMWQLAKYKRHHGHAVESAYFFSIRFTLPTNPARTLRSGSNN